MSAQLWLENLAAYSLQVAVLVIAGTALVYLFRMKAPNALLAFWQAMLAVCLLLPALQTWRQAPQQMQAAALSDLEDRLSPALSPLMAAQPALTPSGPAPFLTYRTIALILGAGVVLRFFWLALGLLRLQHYRNQSRRLSVLPESIRAMQWSVGVAPDIFLSAEIDSPVTFGWQQPAVLFPESFLAMSATLQRPIACHELLHVERRDWLFIVFEEILRSLFWFHPAVWWALGRVHLSREQVVDREVLRVTGERGPYLESLLHIASLRGRPAAVPAPLLLKERHLVQRVALMLKESSMTKTRLIFSLVAIAAFLIGTGTFTAAWFPLTAPPTPAAAQNPASPTAQGAPPTVTINADGMPVADFFRMIANILELSPIQIDPNLKGTVTFHSTAPMSKQDVSDLFQRILKSNNAALEKSGQTYKIVLQPVPGIVPPNQSLQAQQGEAVRVSSTVQASKLVTKVEPVYPELARRARVSGLVMLEVTVNEDGEVAGVRVMRGHLLLDQAAIDAVMQWRYSPMYLNGKAVSVIATVNIIFNPSSTTASATPSTSEAAADPAVQSPQRGAVKVGASVQESKLIERVDPAYPEVAKRARVSGVVTLEITVNEMGEVASVRVDRGHPLLNQAAVDAVKQWRYSPTYIDGKAVPVVTTVPVVFQLGK